MGVISHSALSVRNCYPTFHIANTANLIPLEDTNTTAYNKPSVMCSKYKTRTSEYLHLKLPSTSTSFVVLNKFNVKILIL